MTPPRTIRCSIDPICRSPRSETYRIDMHKTPIVTYLLITLLLAATAGTADAQIYLDNQSSCPTCTDGATTYDPATRSTGSGSDTVYTSLGSLSSNIQAGQEHLLRSGTYTRNTGNVAALQISASGTAGAYTVVEAYPGEERLVIIGTDPAKLQYNPDPSQGADGDTSLSTMYYPNPAVGISGSYVRVSGVKTYGMVTITGDNSIFEYNDVGGGGPGLNGQTTGQGQVIMIHSA